MQSDIPSEPGKEAAEVPACSSDSYDVEALVPSFRLTRSESQQEHFLDIADAIPCTLATVRITLDSKTYAFQASQLMKRGELTRGKLERAAMILHDWLQRKKAERHASGQSVQLLGMASKASSNWIPL